ncbi:hypothetical protein BV25DRAFT_1910635 [Artomyces pyxidatus]|uniref:Uncharacterized protein n=1 Tax=Artomyces pyxidatus TaxID=48021 RepID=A0ACB8TKH4_9AGAM|nr:hypothetical protein BV25DRAFT_1910635 [Artomyces pyxidatus]
MTTLFPLPSPALPEFKSLLVKGPYHASAPLHLCLTHVANRPGTKAVFLSPLRDQFLAALRGFNDDWLSECGGFGAVSDILSKVDAFYPPTPLHLSLILSMLRVPNPEDDPSVNVKAVLDRPPSLIVLHEMSLYFLDDNASSAHTLSSYLTLVAHASSVANILSAQTPDSPISLVLMDSAVDSLKLPVLKRPTHLVAVEPDVESSESSYRVAHVARRYFEWVGAFDNLEVEEDPPQTASSPVKIPKFAHRLSLYETLATVLAPGSAFNPVFLAIVDGVLALLAITFIALAYLSGGNLHILALLCIELCLWASIKWFVNELQHSSSPPAESHPFEKKKTS